MGPRGALTDFKGGTGWEDAREKGSCQNVQNFQRQVPPSTSPSDPHPTIAVLRVGPTSPGRASLWDRRDTSRSSAQKCIIGKAFGPWGPISFSVTRGFAARNSRQQQVIAGGGSPQRLPGDLACHSPLSPPPPRTLGSSGL